MRCLAAALLTLALLASGIVAAADKSSEWERTVQAAKKEGQVTVYVHSTYAPALESGAFQKAFPDIKLLTVSGVELDAAYGKEFDVRKRFLKRAGLERRRVRTVNVDRHLAFFFRRLDGPLPFRGFIRGGTDARREQRER